MGYLEATGMSRFRIPSLGACRETQSVTRSPVSVSARMRPGRPQVDTDTCRMLMFSPPGSPSILRKVTTLSKLSSGSPLPISTTLSTGRRSGLMARAPRTYAPAATTSPSISKGARSRTFPPRPDAQKAQPIAQPTCVETHSVFPYR